MARTRMVPLEDYNDMRADYEALRQENIDLRAGKSAPKPGGLRAIWRFIDRVFGFLFTMLAVAAALVVIYFFLFKTEVPASGTTPAQASAVPTSQLPPTSGYSGSSGGPGSLPPCSSVADTRTACQPDEQPAAAPIEQLPTEAPAPTATPEYLTSCVSGPGDPPCWAPDAPPALPLPETPIVLLPETPAPAFVFADAACASWRPPLKLPEGCGDE